jgi:hypothetical protein
VKEREGGKKRERERQNRFTKRERTKEREGAERGSERE